MIPESPPTDLIWKAQEVQSEELGKNRLTVLEHFAEAVAPLPPPDQQAVARVPRWRQLQGELGEGLLIAEDAQLQLLAGELEPHREPPPPKPGLFSAPASAPPPVIGSGLDYAAYTGQGRALGTPQRGHLLVERLSGRRALLIEASAFGLGLGRLRLSVPRPGADPGGCFTAPLALSGDALIALSVPCHPSEVQKISLKNGLLRLDPALVLAHTEGLGFRGSEGGRGTYYGEGQVWVAPSLDLRRAP